MNTEGNRLQDLADRVRRGDGTAAAELRRQLRTSMGPLVRRALDGGSATPLTERLAALARRTGRGDERPSDLVACVSATVGEQVVGRLRSQAASVVAAPTLAF